MQSRCPAGIHFPRYGICRYVIRRFPAAHGSVYTNGFFGYADGISGLLNKIKRHPISFLRKDLYICVKNP